MPRKLTRIAAAQAAFKSKNYADVKGKTFQGLQLPTASRRSVGRSRGVNPAKIPRKMGRLSNKELDHWARWVTEGKMTREDVIEAIVEAVFKNKGQDAVELRSVAAKLKAQGKPPMKHFFSSGMASHPSRLRSRFTRSAAGPGGPAVFPSKRTDPKDFSKAAKRRWKARQN